ncbi:unnamed protein product [Parascedosporium putredinis]|uniref:Uncharacterized protein n=1 Tax=Parascedosporium putredinis TaxID=1442378 RepID=A0A9P1H4C2_9PEZI|nr:unnamed protein product [Parascedosporium putredinis]CAI7995513.1 unnamed protein product [Parascedosporium putredinis]
MSETAARDWTIVLVLTALCLSIVVLSQILTTYASAYLAAPNEITVFLDTVDFSIIENETYDRDIAKLQGLEDKVRLGRLLREIQRGGDDLREEVSRLLIDEDTQRLRTSARLLWASNKRLLEDRVRRLDQLRMRFLVLYLGVITTTAAKTTTSPPRDPEKSLVLYGAEANGSPRASLAKSLTESIGKRPPLRRLTTQAIGHHHDTAGAHKQGWFGVVQELQRSPRCNRGTLL